MKRIAFLLAAAFACVGGTVSADLINEFEPNPLGTDPTLVSIELSGTPGAAFSGFLSSLESDVASGMGQIDRSAAVSGTYDANGLAVVEIGDLENPSYTFMFSSLDGGGLGTDYDTDNDGTLDVSLAAFGTIFDAVGITDNATDPVFGDQLGGIDIAYSGDEPKIAFRDSLTGDWYVVNDAGDVPEEVFDANGNLVSNSSFSADPELTTFGSANPFFNAIPEPTSALVLSVFAGIGLMRRRR
ncbi:MAG: hypothetical protein AAF456_19705 [Planctomycetota bacterium]